MWRRHRCLGRDGIFGAVLVYGSDHDLTVRLKGQWEGGDHIVGRGHDERMKVKNNNDDEANATTTITTTSETTMTICVVNNGNCRIIDC
jgi:hypothetical protein